jgi:hypothetical protein
MNEVWIASREQRAALVRLFVLPALQRRRLHLLMLWWIAGALEDDGK